MTPGPSPLSIISPSAESPSMDPSSENFASARSADRTCRLVTLGCKVNQYETQLVKEALAKHGYREADEHEVADLCFVNTCTVTANGESRSRQVVRQLAKSNPGTRTIVVGCGATRAPEDFRKLPSVFDVVTDRRELPDVLQRYGVVDFPRGIERFEGRKRAYVKVQDGCALRCTYCIIPQVRPNLISREPLEIEQEVRRLIANGYQEIVLTGVHIGHYGVDLHRRTRGAARVRLWDLIDRLDGIEGHWRMRLSSIEAAEMPTEFIDCAASARHVCPQFHPALQSGSNAVLARMRRRYTREKFLDVVDQLKSRLPHPGFSTDVIVGFPGETEAEFQETLDLCREIGFTKIHSFSFSARAGTPAASLPGRVHGDVIDDRLMRLRQLEAELAQSFCESLVGTKMEVMVESIHPTLPGYVLGTDRRYCQAMLRGTSDNLGELRESLVIGASQGMLIGG
jgi:threonylcarbamoyladenosine tRNA methylthiotransferase MtaB